MRITSADPICLSCVVPAYNEGAHIAAFLADLWRALRISANASKSSSSTTAAPTIRWWRRCG